MTNEKSANSVVLPFFSENLDQQERKPDENIPENVNKGNYLHAYYGYKNPKFLLNILVFNEDLVEVELHEAGPAIQDSNSEGLVEVVLYEADATKENSSESL